MNKNEKREYEEKCRKLFKTGTDKNIRLAAQMVVNLKLFSKFVRKVCKQVADHRYYVCYSQERSDNLDVVVSWELKIPLTYFGMDVSYSLIKAETNRWPNEVREKLIRLHKNITYMQPLKLRYEHYNMLKSNSYASPF